MTLCATLRYLVGGSRTSVWGGHMVRVRCVVSVLLLLVALPLAAAARQKATRPPKNLHRIGDHWTAYYPPDPATFPAGSRVHTIVRGDTLWDLARTYYGEPYLWPQLWESNTYITDAHWIYPGDPLLIQGEIRTGDVATAPRANVGQETGAGLDEDGSGGSMTTDLSASGPPVPIGTEHDVLCWGYLGHPDEPLPNRITSFEDTETRLVEGAQRQEIGGSIDDIIFIEGGASTGLVAGETYLVVRPDAIVEHPATEEPIGRHYDYRGRVRILCVSNGLATGIITQACKEINIGDRLKPMPQVPIPLARETEMANTCTPPNGKKIGFIVNAKDALFSLGIGHLVEINLGTDDALQPGDFVTVFRDNQVQGLPRQVLGEAGILTVEGQTATARIMRMRYEMRIGDRVELK